MKGRRLVVVDAQDLLNLLTMYTDGDVPLDAELLDIAVSPYLERMIAFLVRSSQWKEAPIDPVQGLVKPLIVRYEGKKCLSWHSNPEEPYEWKERSNK